MNRLFPPIAGLVALLLSLALSHAQEQSLQPSDRNLIGVVAPISGPYSLLGQQFSEGLQASPLGEIAVFSFADTRCTKEGGEQAAAIIDNPALSAITGLLCVDALDAIRAAGIGERIPLVVPAMNQIPAELTLTAASETIVHFGPPAGDDAQVLASHLSDVWRSESFAIIDDGTLYGRTLANGVGALLAEQQLEPVFRDTYRPRLDNQVALVRRLARSGATKVLIGGDGYDAAIITAAARQVGLDLTIAGGAALIAPAEDGLLLNGTIAAALPDFSQTSEGQQAVAALKETGIVAEGYHFWGYATGQVIASMLKDGVLITGAQTLNTTLGSLSFSADGRLNSGLHRIHIRQNGTWVLGQVSGDG